MDGWLASKSRAALTARWEIREDVCMVAGGDIITHGHYTLLADGVNIHTGNKTSWVVPRASDFAWLMFRLIRIISWPTRVMPRNNFSCQTRERRGAGRSIKQKQRKFLACGLLFFTDFNIKRQIIKINDSWWDHRARFPDRRKLN